MTTFSQLERWFRELAPTVSYCSLRAVRQRNEWLQVRRDVVQPVRRGEDLGVMVSVEDGGHGYAATADPSPAGLRRAFAEARAWARQSANLHLLETASRAPRACRGEYRSPVQIPWDSWSLHSKLELLRRLCARTAGDGRIVERRVGLGFQQQESLLLDSDGARLWQQLDCLLPSLSVSAHHRGETQRRSFGGDTYFRQGGLEILEAVDFEQAPARVVDEALTLLAAPNCPDGERSVILAPDQMVLQIHESIGHPLELDRILGDERNYAGRSFVTPAMFGHYRYGSALLNVTFDPTTGGEVASYGFDDEGLPAQREYLIRDGILLRGLGGGLSQRRSGLPGVASSRACHWNRPPIDRMANLNLEPGDSTLDALIAGVERGIYLQTNCSWSIDDSRDKFQFGCEWGRLIEDGELTTVVKNPNYRGISAGFWRQLDGVGDAASRQVLAAANCGKGEPNQAVRVGHASPPCRFQEVMVFGGEGG